MLAGGVDVVRLELGIAELAGGDGLRVLRRHLEKHRHGGGGGDGAELPGARAAHADLRLRHARRLLVQRGAAADGAGDLELAGGDDGELGVEAHAQGVLLVAREHSLERLLEDHVRERVRLDDDAPSLLNARLHLGDAALVQRTREHVHYVPVLDAGLGDGLVVRGGLLVPLGRVVVDVHVCAHRLFLLHRHHLPRALSAGAAEEEHEAGGVVGVGALE
mmetsp:Transcript_55107/g.112697  ORF Transcript_55107/g.112697 Transcript_55107/m.112697 type:complete len:219 (+) Transcript_55107:1023-1679(+)